MMKLCAFADEISPELDEQIKVCRENQITHFELRGVYGKNVLDFDPALRSEIKTKLGEAGLGVACIGSPIGKVSIDQPWQAHFDRFKIAVDAAEFFGAPLIRVFSYYAPEGGKIKEFRSEVLERFNQKIIYIADRPITLVHENETKIFGETGVACLELMKSINSPKLRSAFDFANFVQAGEKPLVNWPLLKPYSVHIHVKDAVAGSGQVVPAGKGDGQIRPILIDLAGSGYDGFLSLEPHLAKHGQFSGFSGPVLFKVAADALKDLCRANGIKVAGVN